MVFKNKKGMFQLQRNFRDSFNEEAFIEKYIEECMDRYLYIVGDRIARRIMRAFKPFVRIKAGRTHKTNRKLNQPTTG